MLSELEKLLMRGGEGIRKIKGTTLGGATNKLKELGKDAYRTVKESPKASGIAGAAGLAGGAGLEHLLSGDDGEDPEERERLARMLQYIHGG